MGLNVHSEQAKIGIQSSRARIEISSKKYDLHMQSQRPQMDMESDLPKVTIDQYPCRATSGMKNMKDLRKQTLDQAVQNLFDFISRRVSEGEVLGAIENKGAPNAFGQAAKSRLDNTHQFGMVTMPSERPKIDSSGKLDINWQKTWEGSFSGVKYQFTRGKINVNFTPGKVEIYMRQMNKIEFSYQSDKIDQQV